jgi:hypothetical protein
MLYILLRRAMTRVLRVDLEDRDEGAADHLLFFALENVEDEAEEEEAEGETQEEGEGARRGGRLFKVVNVAEDSKKLRKDVNLEFTRLFGLERLLYDGAQPLNTLHIRMLLINALDLRIEVDPAVVGYHDGLEALRHGLAVKLRQAIIELAGHSLLTGMSTYQGIPVTSDRQQEEMFGVCHRAFGLQSNPSQVRLAAQRGGNVDTPLVVDIDGVFCVLLLRQAYSLRIRTVPPSCTSYIYMCACVRACVCVCMCMRAYVRVRAFIIQ